MGKGGGEVGVNIVMISPEFRSSGPMRRERDREGEIRGAGGYRPVTAGKLNRGDTSSSSSQPKREKREGCCEKIEVLTHTHTHQTPSAGPSDTSHQPIRVLTERRGAGFLSQSLFFKNYLFVAGFFFPACVKRFLIRHFTRL